ncbi:MAG: hypothetical protein HRU13_07415 [Phycisphaerales bacterium]|nr:hypothetical protein [Phycisphaerales bacterium]
MPLIPRADASSLARDAVVLDLGDLARQGRSIVERAEAEAQQMIANAQAERERLIGDATERGYADGLAKGLEEGRKQGHEQGQAEAIAAERDILEALQGAWTEALASFEKLRGQLQLEAERGVLELALKLGERVAKRAIEYDDQAAARQLVAAIELAMAPSRLRVKVSPEGAAAVRAALPRIAEKMHDSPSVVVVEDPSLSHGSVVIDADETSVDATIETQIARIIEALLPGSTDGAGDTAADESS